MCCHLTVTQFEVNILGFFSLQNNKISLPVKKFAIYLMDYSWPGNYYGFLFKLLKFFSKWKKCDLKTVIWFFFFLNYKKSMIVGFARNLQNLSLFKVT